MYKVSNTAINRILHAIAEEIFVLRNTNISENETVIYIPGYILKAIQVDREYKIDRNFKWKLDFNYHIYGCKIMPGYEQSKIVISNTLKEIYPDCIRRVEILLDTRLKDNVIPFNPVRYSENSDRKIPINEEGIVK